MRVKQPCAVDADIIVAVKRLTPPVMETIRRSGKPWIWDLVDFYPQPGCRLWSCEYATKWVRKQIEAAAPNGVVYPNQRMADDIGIPGRVVYHHHMPSIRPVETRKRITRVGYIGRADYLSWWHDHIAKKCQYIGAKFVVNEPIQSLDVVVAMRGGDWNGYCQRRWKSNVKLANAMAAGLPFICTPENGYMETGTGDEMLVACENRFGPALGELSDYGRRLDIRERYLERAKNYSLDRMADEMRDYCREVLNKPSA